MNDIITEIESLDRELTALREKYPERPDMPEIHALLLRIIALEDRLYAAEGRYSVP